MAKAHIYRLSSIDQVQERSYIRCGLCFPCDNNDGVVIGARLRIGALRAVSKLPILAGTVLLDKQATQQGRALVSVTLDQLQGFDPVVKCIGLEDYPHTFESLARSGFPPAMLDVKALTPPTAGTAGKADTPAFIVQGNIIEGGIIVTLYLHHSVGDIQSLFAIMRPMSDLLPTRRVTEADLEADALHHSRFTKCLCSSVLDPIPVVVDAIAEDVNAAGSDDVTELSDLTQGVDHCRVFAIKLNMIGQTTELINSRYHDAHEDNAVRLARFDCLAVILWKALTRAAWPNGSSEIEQLCTLTIPVDFRDQMAPPLDDEFYGNTVLAAKSFSSIARLSMPYELSNLAHTAGLVEAARTAVTGVSARRAITAIDAIADLSHSHCVDQNKACNLAITSWLDLDTAHADLGMSLGKPQSCRQLGKARSGMQCTVLPVTQDPGCWEVHVQAGRDIMDRLLQDEGFMKYVK